MKKIEIRKDLLLLFKNHYKKFNEILENSMVYDLNEDDGNPMSLEEDVDNDSECEELDECCADSDCCKSKKDGSISKDELEEILKDDCSDCDGCEECEEELLDDEKLALYAIEYLSFRLNLIFHAILEDYYIKSTGTKDVKSVDPEKVLEFFEKNKIIANEIETETVLALSGVMSEFFNIGRNNEEKFQFYSNDEEMKLNINSSFLVTSIELLSLIVSRME